MGSSFRSFQRNIRRLVEGHSGEYFETKVGGDDIRRYKIPILPHKGPRWFIVEIYPPSGYEGGEKPVELLFLLKDLYLLGVFGGGKLRLFNDADKSGMDLQFIKDHVKPLGFSGGYGDVGPSSSYTRFIFGLTGQIEAYAVLSRFEKNSSAVVGNALCLVLITVSEAIRFPKLAERFIAAFEEGQYDKTLDDAVVEGEKYKQLSFHFTNWDKYCTAIRDGEHMFDTEKYKRFGFP